MQGSLQLEGVVREGLAYVARDAHAYADEISEHSALEVRSVCVILLCVGVHFIVNLCHFFLRVSVCARFVFTMLVLTQRTASSHSNYERRI